MKHKEDLTGKQVGKWTVVGPDGSSEVPNRWICRCECGTERSFSASYIKGEKSKSCGCAALMGVPAKGRPTHNLSRTKLHGVWCGMLQRCYYKKHIDNEWYSAKGLEVCDEWRHDFEAFYRWAQATGYHEGLSIDRIKNDKGYSPDNCRWATPSEQANNRTTNINITYQGRTQTLKQWARELDIHYLSLYHRYKKGVPFEIAITQINRKFVA